MPEDVEKKYSSTSNSYHSSSPSQSGKTKQKPWFTTPAPVKLLFDKFPLQTYPPNELPKSLATGDSENVLYVFNTQDGARRGIPSFNPSCLKWQVSNMACVHRITLLKPIHRLI